MKKKQKQTLESFVRVRAFIQTNPAAAALNFGGASETLDESVRRLREHAGAQLSGRQLGLGEIRRQRQMVRQLLDRHMRPIVAIARAQVEPHSDVRIPAALRMPRNGIGVTRILQACDGMIEAARPFEATFIAHGLPTDFLARFTAARHELEAMLGGRAAHVAAHVAARAGLEVELRRGRRAVDRIDAVVRASFSEDPMTLASWRAAKRVQLLPGRSGGREDEEEVAPVLAQAA
jgi:hypothetical protein